MSSDRWLSVDEIASHLGIKCDTVYRWISEKKYLPIVWDDFGSLKKPKLMNG